MLVVKKKIKSVHFIAYYRLIQKTVLLFLALGWLWTTPSRGQRVKCSAGEPMGQCTVA